VWGIGLIRFLDDRPVARETGPETDAAPVRRGVFSRHLLMIGLVTLMATTVEGAAADWLAIYLADERGTSDAVAALGFAVFAAAMTAGRFAGTPITERLGRARAVRIGGVLGIVGVLLTVLPPSLPVAYAGMVLWAVGICLVFPAAVSAAGETARPAESIAMVTTLGYGAILVGPPLIGTLADQIGLGRALLVLVVLSVGVVVLAPAVRETTARDTGGEPADQSRSASIAR
jgi:fucose permease